MSAPFRILTIPGDGIGREVVPAALEVLRGTGLPLAITQAEAGWECFQRHGASLPDEALAAARASDAVLFGAVASPSHPVPGYRSPIVALRKALDLHANIRPVVGLRMPDDELRIGPGLSQATSHKPRAASHGPPATVDLVIVRENTEGLYAGRERIEDGGETAIAERVITRRASERIVRTAFELARARSVVRGSQSAAGAALAATSHQPPSARVTIVHKANILRETCGLFRRVALEVAQGYPEVAAEELLIDTCALQLVQQPERFDVIVTTNLFGDILSDVACYWGGGLGTATSANLGDRYAVFEPVHGAAPDIAGKGIANPVAAVGCVAMLLEHLSRRAGDEPDLSKAALDWSHRIDAALHQVMVDGPHSPDLGGSAGTAEVVHAVLTRL